MADFEGQVLEDADVTPPAVASMALVPQVHSTDLTLFGHDDPEVVIERASKIAKILMRVVEQQTDPRKLIVPITNRRGEVTSRHPRLEAWTTIGSQVGVFPVFVKDRRLHPEADSGMDGWEAQYEARKRDGSVVGSAVSMCLRDEDRWKNAAEFEVRSMANTRAAAKAMRMALSFVMTLAGYDPTPAEEMDAFAARQEAEQSGGAARPAGKPQGAKPAAGEDPGALRNAILSHGRFDKKKYPIAKVRGGSVAELKAMLAELNGEGTAVSQPEAEPPPAAAAPEDLPADPQLLVDSIESMPNYDAKVYGAIVAARDVTTLQELLTRLRQEAPEEQA